MQRCRNLKSTKCNLCWIPLHAKKARRWMRVDGGWPVDAEQLASRLRVNLEFGQKVAD